MKVPITMFLLLFVLTISAQEIVNLPHANKEGVTWTGGEKKFYSKIWNTEVVCNVSVPTMEVFRPDAANANGASVIVAPGGGLYALSIESEGNMVAKWLTKKGITAFVLKYRLVPTKEDGVQEITELSMNDPEEIGRQVSLVLPLSIADGLTAIKYVREHADELGVEKNKIGFMGFSAGGAVTMGVAYECNADNRPDFIVPVYPWTTAMPVQEVPLEAPPMLVICASDDPLGLAPGSIALYNSWLNAKKPVGLHMYSKGGHGFGMKEQNLPSDTWIQRFYDWSVAEGITTVTN
jgi:acetyl esterase/lipase